MIYKQKVKNLVANRQWFAKLEQYVAMVLRANKMLNLTAFSAEQIWRDGIYESLAVFQGVKLDQKMLDIGAGVGFPSLPLLITNPHLNLTIIEAQAKRIRFLKTVLETLNINAKLINTRVETFCDEQFGLITARAVAPLFKLVEISHRLGMIGATYYFIKGPNVVLELRAAKDILQKLNIGDVSLIKQKLPFRTTYLVRYSKQHATPPGLPRRWAQIK